MRFRCVDLFDHLGVGVVRGRAVRVKGCFNASNFHNRTGMGLATRRTCGVNEFLN